MPIFSQAEKIKLTSIYPNKSIAIISTYTIEIVKNNPDWIFIFGDNLIGKGKGGQAIIRDEPNTFGIPTKRLPTMDNTAFFSDKNEEEAAVIKAIFTLRDLYYQNKKLVFPKNGIGTGLARLKEVSPKIYNLIDKMFQEYFQINIM